MLNVDIMMLYISAVDNTRKLKFSSYIPLPSNKQNARKIITLE